MFNAKKRIITGITVSACAVAGLGVYAISARHDDAAVPISADYHAQKPVIVLDAGHGEST